MHALHYTEMDLSSGPKADFEEISPGLALAYLASTRIKRPVQDAYIDFLARQMQHGLWATNSASIAFDAYDALLDGQARLMACVRSGVPFRSLVVRGLPAASRATIDAGRKWTVAEQLAALEEPNAAHIASVVRWVYALATMDASFKIGTPEVVAFLSAHPELRASASKGHAIKAKGAIPALLSALHFAGVHSGRADRADAFLQVFRTGVPDYPGDVAHAYREKQIEAKISGRKTSFQRQMTSAVHVWNLFQDKVTLSFMRTPPKVTVKGFDPSGLNLFLPKPYPISPKIQIHKAKRVRGLLLDPVLDEVEED